MLTTLLAMDPVVIGVFAMAALLLNVTPGPDMMFITASGLAGGLRGGCAAALGVAAGVFCHILLAAAGLAALLTQVPMALDVIRFGGAAYLLYIAWRSWNASEPTTVRGRSDVVQAFRRGLLTNLFNPKVALFILAFLPQFTNPEAGPVAHQILWLGSFLVLSAAATGCLLGYFAGLLAARIRRGARLLNRIAAVLFGGLAARLAVG
ncbi:Threonine/homoserine/homoserine lactone efflux protein [Poseidonocella pacifica]|uniref:Threonine/homoserine/homoserine lactone efflux protein n=1 Tax=Poseidonocella pacifica TaxID=871651 RepID=A0A1I0XKU8_9RHOB|nr:LysE family translocator [Poseidonocella pacifica]SFB01632.1 Threonine/homoserine/homoserine lactone efflux protein [Poseidonocella pacifica]